MEEPVFSSYLSLLRIVLQSSGTDGGKLFESKNTHNQCETKTKTSWEMMAWETGKHVQKQPKGAFFVPSMSFGEVCGKAPICELSFQQLQPLYL